MQAPTVAGVVYLSDFASLQNAINATPNGGTVIIPAGVHEIGTVEINDIGAWVKVITLQGVAAGYFPSSAPRGSGEWDYLINGGYTYGTILRGTITATRPGAKLRLRDLAMIGNGEGIAVDIGNGSVMFPDSLDMQGVFIGNYETAVRVRHGYYLSLHNVSIAGVDNGLLISGSNVVRISDIDVMTCELGASLDGDTVSFVGGSVQGCAAGVVLNTATSTLGGVHFEGIDGYSVEIAGSGNNVDPNFYASNAGGLLISGNNNIVTLGLNPVDAVELAGNYNRVAGSAYLQCDDSGYRNICESPSYP